VVILRKIIYSALLLALVLLCVSLLYLLLSADFLAASQALVYVGAVNVLIVFAIMLVNKPEPTNAPSWTLADGMAGLIAVLLFGILLSMILRTPWLTLNDHSKPLSVVALPNTMEGSSQEGFDSLRDQSIQTIGFHFLTNLLVPFELLSILLLVTLIGAITIARQEASTKGLDTPEEETV
jgi:NAD(P)H-quinone oxidoreductase subunit 6